MSNSTRINRLSHDAICAISSYKKDIIIMSFLTTEAIEKTRSDIKVKSGLEMSLEEFNGLMAGSDEVKDRVENYIQVGLIACYMAVMCKRTVKH